MLVLYIDLQPHETRFVAVDTRLGLQCFRVPSVGGARWVAPSVLQRPETVAREARRVG